MRFQSCKNTHTKSDFKVNHSEGVSQSLFIQFVSICPICLHHGLYTPPSAPAEMIGTCPSQSGALCPSLPFCFYPALLHATLCLSAPFFFCGSYFPFCPYPSSNASFSFCPCPSLCPLIPFCPCPLLCPLLSFYPVLLHVPLCPTTPSLTSLCLSALVFLHTPCSFSPHLSYLCPSFYPCPTCPSMSFHPRPSQCPLLSPCPGFSL